MINKINFVQSRKVVLLLTVLVTGFFSCKKDNDSPSRSELLVAKTWIYQEYYDNFSTTSVRLLYKRGSSGNRLNLDADYITFKKDGTYERRDLNGVNQTGTWKYTDNNTKVTTVENGETHSSTTINLSASNYTWHDVPNNTYGIMIPQ